MGGHTSSQRSNASQSAPISRWICLATRFLGALATRLPGAVDTISKVVTTAAIIIGGYWTYALFIQNREGFPHANLSQKVTTVDIDDQLRLLIVDVTIENTGNVLLRLHSGFVRVENVQVSEIILDEWKKRQAEITFDSEKYRWNTIREFRKQWANGEFELEPKEKDILHCEFIISKDKNMINIYAHLDNPTKQAEHRTFGWNIATLVDFRDHQS